MTGYDYGNARLRAMRSRLLDMNDYAALVAVGSLDAFLGALHSTPFEPDLEAAMTRETGLRSVDDAIRHNLARALRAMRSFYADEAGRQVGLLVRRWDVRNLRTLLRALALLRPSKAVAPELVPAGDLTETELNELAEQPGVRSLVDLMVAWELPNRTVARRVHQQLPAVEAGGEIAVLERTLFQAWGEAVADHLSDLPDELGLALMLRSEIDQSNVLAVVRYWEAAKVGESVPLEMSHELTPGGRISHGLLLNAVRHEDRDEVARRVNEAPGLPGWDTALGRWAGEGDPTQLAEDMARVLTESAVRMFAADPLDSSVPTAFTFAKEAEARNVRLIARGVIHGLHPDEIIEHLVVAA